MLPLFLFREHWDIARRRAPPLFGLACTLDVMGYVPTQQFTIPFKVLLKALHDAEEKPTSINAKIVDLVLETCKVIIRMNEEFRKNLVKQINDFIAGPEFRSADIVPSIQIFLAQLYALLQIEKIKVGEDLVAPIQLSKQQLQKLFRFAFEEEHRRNLARSGKEAFNDQDTLDLLFPEW